MSRNRSLFGIALVAMAAVMFAPASARAHCDALDGPVVKAAQKALSTGNVDLYASVITAAFTGTAEAATDIDIDRIKCWADGNVSDAA